MFEIHVSVQICWARTLPTRTEECKPKEDQTIIFQTYYSEPKIATVKYDGDVLKLYCLDGFVVEDVFDHRNDVAKWRIMDNPWTTK